MYKRVDMPFVIVSFCLVGMLGLVWKLYTSKEEAVDAFSSLQARFMTENRLEVGDYVPALGVSDRSGQKHLLEVVGRPRLTLLVSAECAGCFYQLENYWPLMTEDPSFSHLNLAIVAASGQETLNDIDALALGQPFYVADVAHMQKAFRISTVPVTVLTSEEGRVVWTTNAMLDDVSFSDLCRAARELETGAAL